MHVEEDHRRKGRKVEVVLQAVEQLLKGKLVTLKGLCPYNVWKVLKDDQVWLLRKEVLQADATSKIRKFCSRDSIVDQDVV